MTFTPIEFFVPGAAKPAGSKTSGVVTKLNPVTGAREPKRREGGGWMTFTKDSSGEKGKTWRGDVRAAAAGAVGPGFVLLDEPLVFGLVFVRVRPKSHYGSGRNSAVLKPGAPPYPTSRPDALKLARAVEDALTGLVWRDDALVVDYERLGKAWGPRPGVWVRISPAPLLAPSWAPEAAADVPVSQAALDLGG